MIQQLFKPLRFADLILTEDVSYRTHPAIEPRMRPDKQTSLDLVSDMCDESLVYGANSKICV